MQPYEDYGSEVTKLGELYANLAKETFKPYQDFAASDASKVIVSDLAYNAGR
jgi:hypothetical protein